jgi:hypothetical protein
MEASDIIGSNTYTAKAHPNCDKGFDCISEFFLIQDTVWNLRRPKDRFLQVRLKLRSSY